jgi:hypothetical protein
MKYEDLSFNITNKDGLEVTCDITCVIPNEENSEEPYVIFTDYTLDENDEFIEQYGKIIDVEGDPILKVITDENIIAKIKEASQDEVVQYVNKEVQDNLE